MKKLRQKHNAYFMRLFH